MSSLDCKHFKRALERDINAIRRVIAADCRDGKEHQPAENFRLKEKR